MLPEETENEKQEAVENEQTRPSEEPQKEEQAPKLSQVNVSAEADKNSLIRDIIASDPINQPTEEKMERFFKKSYNEEETFSILELDSYLDRRFYFLPDTVKAFLEIIIVAFVLMLFPVTCVFIQYRSNGFNILFNIFNLNPHDNLISYVQLYIFLVTAYSIYVLITLFSDNILFLSITILNFFQISIDENTIQLLQVTKATSIYWKWAAICYLSFYFHTEFIYPYQFEAKTCCLTHLLLTFLLWYTCLMIIISVEKFFMTLWTADMRRKEYRSRIWDINYRTFVFTKIYKLSKVQQPIRSELGETMQPEFDPGFYIKYGGLRLDTPERSKDLAESILAYLEKTSLDYSFIKEIFPDNYKEVFEFLLDKKIKPEDEETETITYERLEQEITKLYNERTSVSRTLAERDIIWNKLDYCLYLVGIYSSLIFLCILLDFDYKVYLASIGPAFFVFGLVFADALKEVYYSFIFLLVKCPYDIGDRVIIEACEYVVDKLDLFSTTFIDVNGRTVYMANSRLFPLKIYNIRISGKQYDEIELLINKNTTYGKGLDILNSLKKEMENSEFFSGSVILRSFITKGDSVAVSYAVEHLTNFQSDEEKFKRREKLTTIIENILIRYKISYNNSFQFKELT